jgi:hypothetical protein
VPTEVSVPSSAVYRTDKKAREGRSRKVLVWTAGNHVRGQFAGGIGNEFADEENRVEVQAVGRGSAFRAQPARTANRSAGQPNKRRSFPGFIGFRR